MLRLSALPVLLLLATGCWSASSAGRELLQQNCVQNDVNGVANLKWPTYNRYYKLDNSVNAPKNHCASRGGTAAAAVAAATCTRCLRSSATH